MTQGRSSGVSLRSGLLIDGHVTHQASGGTFDHYNPATGKLQHTGPLAGFDEVNQAVESARRAFPEWRRRPVNERRDLLLRLAELLRQDGRRLAEIGPLENGTPIRFSANLAGVTAEWFTYFAGWADKVNGETIPLPAGRPSFDYTLAEPFGVVALIIPWNGPLGSIGMKAAPALAAGNCVVIKPSELTPFSPLRFGELCLEAGIPPGVVNVVPGSADAGEALVRHAGVNKVSFTGGTATGAAVMRAAAEHLTPVTLELGGKSANIVFADSDLEAAIPASVFGGAGMLSGQGCKCPTRLLVEASVYEEAVERAVAAASSIAIGDPSDPATVMGPVISAQRCAAIESLIDQAKAEGGTLLTGGSRLGGNFADGYFLPPTIFGGVQGSSGLAQTEVFGPVIAMMRFTDEEDAVRIANESAYGLAAYLWTSDLGRAHDISSRLDAGSVTVNAPLPPFGPHAPRGGFKQSGFGLEGGKQGLEDFLRTKNVFMALSQTGFGA